MDISCHLSSTDMYETQPTNKKNYGGAANGMATLFLVHPVILPWVGALWSPVGGIPTIEANMESQAILPKYTAPATEIVGSASFIYNVGVILNCPLLFWLHVFLLFPFFGTLTLPLLGVERLRGVAPWGVALGA